MKIPGLRHFSRRSPAHITKHIIKLPDITSPTFISHMGILLSVVHFRHG